VLFSSLGRREAGDTEGLFSAYLAKPVHQSQLFDTLVGLLAHAMARKEIKAAKARTDPDMAARHPLRILLAEDNVVNQKLALRILTQMGYRADLASNGVEAVESLVRQTYDVVLMTCRCPRWIGLEASRRINAQWPEDKRPRIVAMTANAMQGDRECAWPRAWTTTSPSQSGGPAGRSLDARAGTPRVNRLGTIRMECARYEMNR